MVGPGDPRGCVDERAQCAGPDPARGQRGRRTPPALAWLRSTPTSRPGGLQGAVHVCCPRVPAEPVRGLLQDHTAVELPGMGCCPGHCPPESDARCWGGGHRCAQRMAGSRTGLASPWPGLPMPGLQFTRWRGLSSRRGCGSNKRPQAPSGPQGSPQPLLVLLQISVATPVNACAHVCKCICADGVHVCVWTQKLDV